MQNCALGKEKPLGFPWDGLSGDSSVEKYSRNEASSALSRSKARNLRETIISFSGLARSCLDIHQVCTSNKDILKVDFSEGPAACSGAGALRREAERRGLAQPGEGTDGWIWSPSSSLLEARSHWRGLSHPGWEVQQGHREALQPPPSQVVKNLTKPTVTCSGLLAEPVLSTGWRGWTPMLLSNLNCLISQTIN